MQGLSEAPSGPRQSGQAVVNHTVVSAGTFVSPSASVTSPLVSRMRPYAGVVTDWQRVVDALVVAGVTRLAPYSE